MFGTVVIRRLRCSQRRVGRPLPRRTALACNVAVCALLSLPRVVGAACDVIPAAETTFRSTLGGASQPFAIPGDWVEISLDARCDGEKSPGFSGSTVDQVVTVAFTPPNGPRNVVTLAQNWVVPQFDSPRRVGRSREESTGVLSSRPCRRVREASADPPT